MIFISAGTNMYQWQKMKFRNFKEETFSLRYIFGLFECMFLADERRIFQVKERGKEK